MADKKPTRITHKRLNGFCVNLQTYAIFAFWLGKTSDSKALQATFFNPSMDIK